MRVVLLALVVLGCCGSAHAQDGVETIDGPPAPEAPAVIARDADGRATMRALALPAPLELDGRLDEAFYLTANSVSDFVQQEPAEGQPATERTEVWIFFDGQDIYMSARMWESQKGRRVTSDMRRDAFNLYNNDHVAVMFDTFYDRRNGYFFYANAQGGMVDAQIVNETPNNNWNGLWDVRTAEFEDGWTAEFKFPFRSMRARQGAHLWGVNFRRVVKWKNEISFLTPIPASFGRRGLLKVSSAGTLVGVDARGGSRNIDVKPYALGSAVSERLSSPRGSGDARADFGFDAKWGITDSVLTDFTYNTDFAQVEDDEAQVNLTRFSLFFPEKREFFLEGQEYFNFAGGGSAMGGGGGPTAIMNNSPSSTPVVFFSRRIGLQSGLVVPILGGGRVLARQGALAIGGLHMRTTDAPEANAADTDFTVLRVNRDLFTRSRVGLIATRRGPTLSGNGLNSVYGADASFNPLTDLSMNGYWAASHTPGRRGNDASYRGNFNWNADRTGVQLEHLFVDKNFNPEIGFIRRAAFRRNFASVRFSPRPARWQAVRKLYYEASYDLFNGTDGMMETREVQAAFRLERNSGDSWAVEVTDNFEGLRAPFAVGRGVTVPAGSYQFLATRGLYTMGPQRKVSGTLVAGSGAFYEGTLTEVTWRGRLEFSSQLYAEPIISWNHIDVPWGTTDTNIFGTRLTYTLTPRTFVGALVQYQSLTANVSTNVRFRWEYQPGSELFVVYSDGRSTLSTGFPSLENRSFVVKATKLFRF